LATLFEHGAIFALLQVILIDIVMAGDNAVVIGMAAARLPADQRHKVSSGVLRRRSYCAWRWRR
jgi:predicted tellurium resistance membrane protein TerC